MSVIDLLLLIVERPLRFFLVNIMLLLSFAVLSVTVVPQEGYPWPGFITYRVPSLVFLFLGTLLAMAFLNVRVLAPIRSWGRLLTFLLTCAAASALLLAITPAAGLVGLAALFIVGFVTLGAFASPKRQVFLTRMVLLCFVLLLLQFVVMPQGSFDLLFKVFGGQTMLTALGEQSKTVSGATEYLVFLGLLLLTGAIALQWPPEDSSRDMTWLLGPPSSALALPQQQQMALPPGQAAALPAGELAALPPAQATAIAAAETDVLPPGQPAALPVGEEPHNDDDASPGQDDDDALPGQDDDELPREG